MAQKIMLSAVAVLVVAVAVLSGGANAATYVVGDSLGWTIPPGGAAAYSTWASSHTFAVGDTLVFNFTTGQHDVARVTKAAFDACTSTSPIFLATVGPASVTLNSTGEQHFICTFGSHCSLGQKLTVNVTGSSSPAPTPPPAAAPTPSPTPITPTTPTPAPSTAPTPSSPSPSSSSAPSPSPSGAVSPPAPTPAGSTPEGSPAPGSSTTPAAPSPSASDIPPPAPSSAPAPPVAAAFAVLMASAICILF